MRLLQGLVALALFTTLPAFAATYPAPREGDWVARDFKFHTGAVLPEVTLHSRTVGEPTGEPVLVLHGTAGSGASMLTKGFAEELFGPGQPLDARRYYIILPDARGDTNDVLYQWESSADFDPSPWLKRIKATVLAINAADDERNPSEIGTMERAMKQIRNGRYLLIPASTETRGHGTTDMAKFYKKELLRLLQQAPKPA